MFTRRTIFLIATISLQLIALAPSARAESGISLGLESYIPPFVWSGGQSPTNISAEQERKWKSVDAEIAEYSKWGAQWNIVNVQQSLGGPGQILWLRNVMEEHQRNGVKVALRLLENPSVYDNFSQVESAEYGFNKEYYEWVKSLAQAFGTQSLYYFIGNETELGVHDAYKNPGKPRKNIPYELYRKLLVTATKAIKSVDTHILVGNCGFSDSAVALVVASDINKRQGLPAAQAFWEKWKKSGNRPVEGSFGLFRLLHNDETERLSSFITQSIRDSAGSDILQMHYYGGWEALPTILQWVANQMQESGAVRPIVASEIGFDVRARSVKEGATSHWQMEMQDYSETEHAENTVKSFTLFLGLGGAERALYWNIRIPDLRNMVMSLFKPSQDPIEFTPMKVTFAYRMLANTLTGLTAAEDRLGNVNDMWHFRFAGAGGRDVTIAWAQNSLLIKTPAGIKEVQDMYGKPMQLGPQLAIDKKPIYLFWKP